MMTHRMLSKNSSSSRAIPVEKLIKLVEEQEVYPLHWGKNQKGMSAKEEITDIELAKEIWGEARLDAIKHAKRLIEIGTHKQVANRLLEPFSSITVIATGTNQPSSWANLFAQRCHESAQPEFKALADLMREAYEKSEPSLLTGTGICMGWHLPFIKEEDWKYLGHYEDATIWDLIKISVGRCARVSFLNHDGKRDIKADIALHDRLLTSKPPHFSPFEHGARSLATSEKKANFVGWQSYRNIIENESNG